MTSATKPPPAQQTRRPRRTFLRAALPLAVGVAIALAPAPHGLALNAWRYFALFAPVIVGIVMEPIPAAAYCAYVVDIFAQASGFRDQWRTYRWVLFSIGVLFAGVLTQF